MMVNPQTYWQLLKGWLTLLIYMLQPLNDIVRQSGLSGRGQQRQFTIMGTFGFSSAQHLLIFRIYQQILFHSSNSMSHCLSASSNTNVSLIHSPSLSQLVENIAIINSRKEEAELTNILIWRKNTTMPVARVHSYYPLDEPISSPIAKFPTRVLVREEKIYKINQVLDKVSTALYLAIQMIIGYHAILYKLGKINIQWLDGFGVNSNGECRVMFPYPFSKQAVNSIGQEGQYTYQIIDGIFSVIIKRSRPEIVKMLLNIRNRLFQQHNLTSSSATILIQEMCNQEKIIIPCMLSPEQQSFNVRLNKSMIPIDSRNKQQRKKNRTPIVSKTQNSMIRESHSFEVRHEGRTKNNSVNWSYIRNQSGTGDYQRRPKTFHRKINIVPAFSMCIENRKQSSDIIRQQKEKESIREKPKRLKCVESYLTTSIGSEKSDFIHSENNLRNPQRFHSKVNQHTWTSPTISDKQLLTNPSLIENSLKLKNDNLVSIVINEEKTVENQEIYKLEKLLALYSARNNQIGQSNEQSFSICQSPIKNRNSILKIIENDSQSDIISPTKIFEIKEIEEEALHLSSQISNGNFNFQNPQIKEIKESVYYGDNSFVAVRNQEDGPKLLQLGKLGRLMKSQIPDTY